MVRIQLKLPQGTSSTDLMLYFLITALTALIASFVSRSVDPGPDCKTGVRKKGGEG